jgi:hypothetical protein
MILEYHGDSRPLTIKNRELGQNSDLVIVKGVEDREVKCSESASLEAALAVLKSRSNSERGLTVIILIEETWYLIMHFLISAWLPYHIFSTDEYGMMIFLFIVVTRKRGTASPH